jgi:hypothetical protein
MVGATRTRYMSPTQRERRTSLSSTINFILRKDARPIVIFINKVRIIKTLSLSDVTHFGISDG